MKRVIVAWLVLGCCGVVLAEVPPAVTPSPRARARALPYPPPAASARPAGQPNQTPSGEKLEHLLKAAAHLQAAGMPDEARRIRQQAEEEKRALLARIDALQKELDQLRQLVRGSQVLVQVSMVEVSRSKMRKLGLDFSSVEHKAMEPHIAGMDGNQPFQYGIVDAGASVLPLLEALRSDGLSRVLAEPTLVTLSGRPAHVHVGGEVPAAVCHPDGTVAVEQREFGTRIDLVPTVLKNGKIRLEVRARVSQIDPSQTVEVEGHRCPGLSVREVDTGVEMNAGQTLILGGLIQDRRIESSAEPTEKTHVSPADAIADKAATPTEESEQIELWVVVRPEILSAPPPPNLGVHAYPPAPLVSPGG